MWTTLCVVLLFLLLQLPSHPNALTVRHFLHLPLELPVIILLLLLLPGRLIALRLALVMLLALLTFLRLADTGMVLAFQRNFNPVLDLHLLKSGWELSVGTFGWPLALTVATGVAVLFIGLFVLVFHAMGRLARLNGRPRRWTGLVAAGLLLVGVALALTGQSGVVETPLVAELPKRGERLHRAVVDESRFAADLATDDVSVAPDFAALKGRDVILLFVESYGRSWLDAQPYAQTSLPRLAVVGDRFAKAGLSVRSGWVQAPTRGGQSWLAHGAVMSGLWTSSQSRYDAVIASKRLSLNRMFAQAGWHSVAVMPAITRDWPEAAWYGYDQVLAHDDLGYQGQPFEWVTMPDQYTLSAVERLARQDGRDSVVEIALITSHAPWTPVPEVLPWDLIGDGSVFDGTQRAGATPRQVWSDHDTIRAAYSRSLDYSIEIVGQWVARYAGDALVVVLGDHQPAPLVAGEGASAAVPIHFISADTKLLDLLPGRWSAGILPETDLAERSMTELRSLFANCFSTGGCLQPGGES
ncbi:sulfatase [Qingshengfaniella alkalisoli]|uniref:Sulfatase n=1 Tax=Qingshengfaniella alkalisoli TaxID=2599296 RepID=A0A5B8I9T5_9RHOB|nr:sulfatase [Qingshengfaniella alkalisoli]QDY71095.1 sulfatase [Qingshengfaniella alkalisoli]